MSKKRIEMVARFVVRYVEQAVDTPESTLREQFYKTERGALARFADLQAAGIVAETDVIFVQAGR